MSFPDDYFDNLARMRAMLPAEDQIAKIVSDFNRFHEAHGAIVDQLRFPIERSRLYVGQIRDIQALARSSVGELSATQAQVLSAAVDLAAAQQLRVNQFQALTSSLRFVDTASLIGERLRNLSIPRSVDFSAYERLIDRHDQIASALAKMTRGAEAILAVSDLAEFTIPAASRELVLANYALDAITVEDEGEESEEEEACIHDIRRDGPDLDSLLEQVNPALVRPYRGIKDAMSSGSVDRTRHVLASTRELCNNVLWLLAPTDTVTRWLEGEGLDMLHKGRGRPDGAASCTFAGASGRHHWRASSMLMSGRFRSLWRSAAACTNLIQSSRTSSCRRSC